LVRSQLGDEILDTPPDGLVARHRGLPAKACEFLNREAHLRDVASSAAVDARVVDSGSKYSLLIWVTVAMYDIDT
jgi:hypothetical protein